jgi:CYTH domain-containing protein
MEIERKFLVKEMPSNLSEYRCIDMEQAYLCTSPVVRVRKENEDYVLTYKGGGMMAREEYNLPLNEKAYMHLLAKADGNKIHKNRFVIPLNNSLKAELDVFKDAFEGIVIVEVEFPDLESANSFVPPEWFGEDVTYDKHYHNSYLSKVDLSKNNFKND